MCRSIWCAAGRAPRNLLFPPWLPVAAQCAIRAGTARQLVKTHWPSSLKPRVEGCWSSNCGV
jgi:hypothetical protein